MLSQCANVQCSKPFLRLREGKLFVVETDRKNPRAGSARARHAHRQVEHYWLCEECAQHWTLMYDRERGVALVPLRRPAIAANTADGSKQSGVA